MTKHPSKKKPKKEAPEEFMESPQFTPKIRNIALGIPEDIYNSINKLLNILNIPETRSTFWLINEPNVHIMGIRHVLMTTIEIINENGFTPYENKVKENLFKVFKIFVCYEDEELNIQEELDLKKEIETNGIIYIKHHDLIYIYEKVRESK